VLLLAQQSAMATGVAARQPQHCRTRGREFPNWRPFTAAHWGVAYKVL
jgi:hypothetical protein